MAKEKKASILLYDLWIGDTALCRGLRDKLFLIGKGERASATREGGSQWSKGRAFGNNLNGTLERLSF